MFSPIRTERLLIRAAEPGDAGPLHARRNDPAVAVHQNWTTPFPMERAEQIVASSSAMGGPTDGEWWMATVCLDASAESIGDLAVHVEWDGRSAEIGYTFASEQWGHGYAVEAVTALVGWLFESFGVHRISAMTHPDNHASNMVLERVGLLFEGHTRGSYWVGDENSDDWLYGMLRADWEAWRDRPRTPPITVSLEEIDPVSALTVCKVKPHRSLWRFVAPREWSFADALFPEIVDGAPLVPWMRAVVADGEIVVFVMLALVTDHHPEPYLWRLLIDRSHQRRGLGKRVLDLVVEQCREWGCSTLKTSWGEGRGSPREFYLSYGFEPTGEIVDDETEARLTFA